MTSPATTGGSPSQARDHDDRVRLGGHGRGHGRRQRVVALHRSYPDGSPQASLLFATHSERCPVCFPAEVAA
jgi:hypothetical protein